MSDEQKSDSTAAADTVKAIDTSAAAKESTAVFDEVAKALTKGSLKTETRTFRDCSTHEDVVRSIAKDARGRTRFYSRSINTEEASLSWGYYYDTSAKLRFVTVRGASSTGSLLETKISLAADGTSLSELNKTVAGPEFAFPKKWPDEDVNVTDPKKRYAAPNSCGEADAASLNPNAPPPAKPTPKKPAATPAPSPKPAK